MRLILAITFIVAGFLLGLAVPHDAPSLPRCPTEDSCSVDYRDGAWHITPDIP